MPNILHFEVDSVLESFLTVFWEKGYKATTTRELAKSAGIAESSLFNSFKSKRDIYLRALKRYSESSLAKREKMDKEAVALEGIHNYWKALGKLAKDTSRRKGCLITNASVEQIEDPEILKYLQSVHRNYDKTFQKVLDRALEQGELKPDTDTMALAQYLSHSAQGLRVLSKLNPSRKKVDNIVNTTMKTLDLYRSEAGEQLAYNAQT